ncbi:MAG: cupin domain-containing protein [Bacteroidetes bacterium]|nr:cupin domain-containing protein [Bacteroidota bacterium]
MKDIFDLSGINDFSKEIFETLFQNENVKIERIVSSGQITPEGEWYDSPQNEWIVLVQGEAELTFADGEVQKLQKGAFIAISAHRKHRVTYTSTNPKAIWLAVHF